MRATAGLEFSEAAPVNWLGEGVVALGTGVETVVSTGGGAKLVVGTTVVEGEGYVTGG